MISSARTTLLKLTYDEFYNNIHTSLLEGFGYFSKGKDNFYIDNLFSNEQTIKLPNLIGYNHIIGAFYYMKSKENDKSISYLVNIGTKEITCVSDLNIPRIQRRSLLAGVIVDKRLIRRVEKMPEFNGFTIQEFGAL